MRTRSRSLAVALVVPLVLSACGGGESDSEPEADRSDTEASASESEAPSPPSSDTATVPADPQTAVEECLEQEDFAFEPASEPRFEALAEYQVPVPKADGFVDFVGLFVYATPADASTAKASFPSSTSTEVIGTVVLAGGAETEDPTFVEGVDTVRECASSTAG